MTMSETVVRTGRGSQTPKNDAPSTSRGPRLRLAQLRDLALLPAIGLILVVGSFIDPYFLTRTNLVNVLQQQSEISLVVLGQVLVMIAGKLDLSLESTVGLAPGIAVWLILPASRFHGQGLELPGFWAVPIALAVGVLVGAINGLLMVRFKLSGFIVTLGMLITLRGLLNGISKGQTFFGLPSSMTYLGTASWLGLPASVWISLSLFAVGIVFMRYHRLGRALYAIGGNQDAAKAAGIRVDRVVWCTLIAASVLAALAGVLLAGRLASVAASSGNGWIFTVFAAAVIGGIALEGGRGRMIGAFTGVVLLGLVNNVLVLRNTSTFWIDAANGAIILIALGLARVVALVRT
jgi:simple sugar transport system permease protein